MEEEVCMDQMELVQYIGNEICEGCGPDRDCEQEFDDCFRIANALDALNEFMEDEEREG